MLSFTHEWTSLQLWMPLSDIHLLLSWDRKIPPLSAPRTAQHLHAAAKSLQSCPTLCDPIDGSPPGSPVPGILQARTLEWVAIPFSNAWKWKVKLKLFSCVRLLATPWIVAYQAPPSMGFSSSFVLNSEIGNCETTKLCSFSRLFWLIWILELPHGL